MAEADGRIWIDLRLMLDNFGKDADRAIAGLEAKMRPLNAMMGRATGSGSSASGAAATDKQTASIVKQTDAIKTKTKAISEELAAWRKLNAGGVVPGQAVTVASPTSSKGSVPQGPVSVAMSGSGLATVPNIGGVPKSGRGLIPPINGAASTQGAKQLLGMGSLFYNGPKPPVIGSPSTSLAGMASSLFNKSLSGPMQALVKVGAALAGLRVGIGLVTFGLKMLLAPAMALVRVFSQAAEAARKLYASSLQSGGLPIAFTQWRQSLAQVLGVGEQEVLQYGRAIAILNKDLQWSNKIIAQTNPTLTAMSWKWKILGQDMHALIASIGYELAPGMNVFAEVMHALITDLSWAVRTLGDMKRVIDSTNPVHWVLKWLFPKHTAPAPVASMNRLAPSEMERAGLVLGNMGIQSPAVQTARNTAKTVSLLEKFLNSVSTQSAFNVYKKAFGAAMP